MLQFRTLCIVAAADLVLFTQSILHFSPCTHCSPPLTHFTHRLYKEGTKDVLVATDIAAKGLDFPDIQHVINFDMPGEIENYVHRIGRTGRCGKTGVATTFINKDVEESALLDLKHLLIEVSVFIVYCVCWRSLLHFV